MFINFYQDTEPMNIMDSTIIESNCDVTTHSAHEHLFLYILQVMHIENVMLKGNTVTARKARYLYAESSGQIFRYCVRT